MKNPDAGDLQYGTRMHYLRKLAKKRAKFTSAHLLLLAFTFIIAFGGLMKLING